MPYKSHKQQLLQNYFDAKCQRTRENPVSLDGQVLNVAAELLDDAYLRYERELSGLQLLNCPTNVDNSGVYYKVGLDPNYTTATNQTTFNSIVGMNNNVSTTLTPYDDTLPVPIGYKLDSNRTSVQISNPILCSITGAAGTETGIYLRINTVVNSSLPIPNKLSFWLRNLNIPYVNIQVIISGTKYPQSLWNQILNQDTEVVTLTKEGLVTSEFPWSYITSINVIGLPTSAILDCHSIGFSLLGKYDSLRPVSLPAFRDQLFNRYWKISSIDNCLEEHYLLDNLTGFVYQQSYNLSTPYSCVEVEPNTWGGFIGSGTTLSYFDRREPLPNLSGTALQTEPCYGLDVYYDVSLPGPVRNITIRPVPYGNANLVVQNRLILTLPDSSKLVYLPDGSTITYSGNTGWVQGAPKTLTIPLSETGQYNITLQCLDQTGSITQDLFPYINFDVTSIVKSSVNISNLVSNIAGISFDFLGQLWIWDGLWAIPIRPIYNGYVLDPIGRNIYLTDSWNQITYS